MTSSTPLQWIRLELIPLVSHQTEFSEMLLWWNPEAGVLQGESAELVLRLIDEALEKGVLQGAMLNHFEITDPLHKPSELAAILAQYFWVIPEPVEAPGLSTFDSASADTSKLQ
ncbi:hypothetical protein [Thiomicrorhabdus cannonii]|uniref:hypothetical protein n=1 Tax=Thiomicrorhabdus cannonii TaxID=2748011 RepID=UPI0015C02B45|nr:hypothetical protein [Thiomicrorhabdus cannonii]